jgi:hypothetical protein|tara:strand:- start:797 stop:1024 length:228 start_codon:yes stop_codon:yes gene_type:complete
MKKLIMREAGVKKILKMLLPKKVRVSIKNWLISSFTSKSDPINQSIKKELLDYYQKDVHLLEKLINKDLSEWMKI